ncbi:MFS general substrate transporter [Hysterangium stoloniferum]|nr:MFS general substrate transporter [Hysterangium stoloniferum]
MALPRTIFMGPSAAHITSPAGSPRPSNLSQITLHMPEGSEVPPTPTAISFRQDVPPPSGSQQPISPSLPLSPQPLLKKDTSKANEPQQDPWDYDPENPRNWSVGCKWGMTGIVSLYTFVAPLASSMMAPALPNIAIHYNITDPTILALTLSVYLLAFAVGPLFLGPMSEVYGRAWILHLSNLFFLAFTIGCAFAPNTGSLIAFRFLAGLGGGAPVSIGGACIGDLFAPAERATAMSMYTLGPLLGPAIGPITGGFISQSIGFRYIFVTLAGLSGLSAAIGIFFFRETYTPVIQERKARRLAFDVEATVLERPGKELFGGRPPPTPPSTKEVLKGSLTRPIILLTRSFICFILSMYMALTYGYLYLLFTTFPDLFAETYGWGLGLSGLAYLGPGIGFVVGTTLSAPLMTKIYMTLTERNGGVSKPEFRMPCMVIGGALVPIGLLWYGWSAQQHLHWAMPIIGGGVFTFGMILIYIPIQLYLVDAFQYAASALAAAAVFRCLFAFCFPLFGEQLTAKLGFGGAGSLLAGIAIVIGVPFPIWIYYKGEQMRARNKLSR